MEDYSHVKTETTTGERTVGVFRCVLERTISRKSAAVGTGAIALRPLVDIVVNGEQRCGCAFARGQNFVFDLFSHECCIVARLHDTIYSTRWLAKDRINARHQTTLCDNSPYPSNYET